MARWFRSFFSRKHRTHRWIPQDALCVRYFYGKKCWSQPDFSVSGCDYIPALMASQSHSVLTRFARPIEPKKNILAGIRSGSPTRVAQKGNPPAAARTASRIANEDFPNTPIETKNRSCV